MTETAAIDKAINLVQDSINADNSEYELSTQLRVLNNDSCSISGVDDYDYPPLEGVLGLQDLVLLSNPKHTPLPVELAEQMQQVQFNCLAGIFPEISRCWITIDHRIFLWNYNNQSDLAFYDGLQEIILTVSLNRPKQGVFMEHIQYILTLTTPSNVVVLGVSFDRDANSEYSVMQFQPDPLFAIGTEGVTFTSAPTHPFSSTEIERILLGAKDGCVYEFYYQAKEGWFTSRCKKINHTSSIVSYILPAFLSYHEDDAISSIELDTSRWILYTLSIGGNISVYDMGSTGASMSRVASISQETILDMCCYTAHNTDKGLFRPIIGIHPLSDASSTTLHLMAVTKAGIRLYFTTTPNGITARPSLLSLVHVRFPPGYKEVALTNRPTRTVNYSYLTVHSDSPFMLSVSHTDNTDVLWVLSNELFAFQSTLMESKQLFKLPSTILCIQETDLGYWNVPQTSPAGIKLPSVVSQHSSPVKEYLVLTMNGIYRFSCLRPLEQLRDLLSKLPADSQQVCAFFSLLKTGQACAIAVYLAADPNPNIASKSQQCFLRYGGSPHYLFTSHQPPLPNTLLPNTANITTTTIPTTIPTTTTTTTTGTSSSNTNIKQYQSLGKAMIGPELIYSDKLYGLAYHICRVLRPIFNHPIIIKNTASNITQYEAYCHPDLLFSIKENIIQIKQFIADTPSLCKTAPLSAISNTLNNTQYLQLNKYSNIPNQQPLDATQQKYLIEAQNNESQLFTSLYTFISLSEQLLSLLILIHAHQLHIIIGALSTDDKTTLLNITFGQIVSNTKPIVNNIISSLIARFHGDETMLSDLSSNLLQLCPDIFSASDEKKAKAEEYLSVAIDVSKDPNQNHLRDSLVRDSMELLLAISDGINLYRICDSLYQLQAYTSIVDLCLSAASRADPDNRAKSFIDSGKLQHDIKGIDALDRRDVCYTAIVSYLDRAYHANSTDPASNVAYNAILKAVLNSGDVFIHQSVYGYLIDNEQTQVLVSINTSHLEIFLKNAAKEKPEDNYYLDLLWRYYNNTGNSISAAKILHTMATNTTSTTLDSRIELLTRAVVCARSQPVGYSASTTSSNAEFIQDIEDKIEVAQIQKGIQHSLIELNTQASVDAAHALNEELLDNTTLFNNYCTQFHLSEWQLAILLSSEYADDKYVTNLWRQIIHAMFHKYTASYDTLELYNKLKDICGKYSRSADRYFPLLFIVQLCEAQSCEVGLDRPVIFRALLDVPIAPSRLVQIYNDIYETKEFFNDPRNFIHLYEVILLLCQHIFDVPNLLTDAEKRQIMEQLSVFIPKYLTELESKDTYVYHGVSQLILSFREIQRQILAND